MPMLSNPRHEAFCHAFVTSGNASAAHRESGGNGRNADVIANQLMRTNGIAERIAELKAEAAAKTEFTRANMLAFLAKVIRTESGQMRDRLRAIELLAKMCGWQAPERHEIDHNFKEKQELVEVIARLRGRGAARNDQSTG
jgi:phage terminase small subunit